MEKLVEGHHSQKDTNQNLFLRSRYETSLQFDYEVNNLELTEKKGEILAYEKKTKKLIDFDQFNDTISNVSPDGKASAKTSILFQANFLKRLVSKKKHRIQNEYFDLDMAYITPRILAMGFPSTGCESMYRNSLKDAKFFLNRYHPEYKVYNLCLENGRIYHKEVFDGKKVALFPFMDHEPCPIKLMLEFCTDLSLYLTRNDNGIGVVHCKAGKGRTGVMIICYLIFSGLCSNSFDAIEYFAAQRTINKKGVTIPSQIRYIQYFETFLSTNFTKPYYKMIPQIMHYHINSKVANTLRNYLNDNSYFFTENKFCLKHLRIGPFKKKRDYHVSISSLIKRNFVFPQAQTIVEIDKSDGLFYLDMDFNSDDLFNFDIKIECHAFKFSFYSWINLWYSTLENLSHYIITNELIRLSSSLLKDGNSLKKSSFLINTDVNSNSTDSLQKEKRKLTSSDKTLNFAADLMKKVEEFENNHITDEELLYEDNDNNIEILEDTDERIDIKQDEIKNNNTNHSLQENINTTTFDNANHNSDTKISSHETSSELIIDINKKESNGQMIELEQVNQIIEETPMRKTRQSIKRSSIGKLIDILKDDKDLIQFVHGINHFASKLNIPIFDMENQTIILEKNNLDKFKDWFGVVDSNFKVEYTYSLEQGK